LAAEVKSKPAVLLVHGFCRSRRSLRRAAAAQAGLEAVGIAVTTETRPGLAHAIDEPGLTRGGDFIAAGFAPAKA